MVLYIPDMCWTLRRAEWVAWRRIARALRMRAASSDVAVLNLYVHATAGRLSHHMAMDWCLSVFPMRVTCASNARKWKKMPASSRSDMVMVPLGFEDEQNSALMSSGQGSNQTMGSMLWDPLNHTPPTPHFEASTKPR